MPALLKLERQNFSHESLDTFVKSLDKAKSLITNDIYHLYLAWSGKGEGVPAGERNLETVSDKEPTAYIFVHAGADLKLTLIQPATEVVSAGRSPIRL